MTVEKSDSFLMGVIISAVVAIVAITLTFGVKDRQRLPDKLPQFKEGELVLFKLADTPINIVELRWCNSKTCSYNVRMPSGRAEVFHQWEMERTDR